MRLPFQLGVIGLALAVCSRVSAQYVPPQGYGMPWAAAGQAMPAPYYPQGQYAPYYPQGPYPAYATQVQYAPQYPPGQYAPYYPQGQNPPYCPAVPQPLPPAPAPRSAPAPEQPPPQQAPQAPGQQPQAPGQQPEAPGQQPQAPQQPTEQPGMTPTGADNQASQTGLDANFDGARSGAGLGEAFAMAGGSPQMMGDLGGFTARHTVYVPVLQTVTSNSPVIGPLGNVIGISATTSTIHTLQRVDVLDPVAVRAGSGFKISDNESPRPQDRISFTYNYYNNLAGQGGSTPATFVSNNVDGSIASTPAVTVPPGNKIDLNRELFSLEKTFFDGRASIGVRVPWYQSSSDGSFGGDGFGDLSMIFKYVLINQPRTGNLISAGVVLTAPTGAAIVTPDGNIDSWLIQPYVGYIFNAGAFFLQGFSAVEVPTNTHDVPAFFNDVEIGYDINLPGHGCVRSFTPVLELHVTTPVRHGADDSTIVIPDIISLTGGVHIGVGEHFLISLGANLPLTGPTAYDAEAIAQINILF